MRRFFVAIALSLPLLVPGCASQSGWENADFKRQVAVVLWSKPECGP